MANNLKDALKVCCFKQENEEIEIGNSVHIIKKTGKINSNFTLNGMLVLGVNQELNALQFYDTDSESLVSFNMDTGEVLGNWDILQGRKNRLYAINKSGDIIAWSECPYGNVNPNADPTKGSGWEVYYANIKTREIKKVDGDRGITLPDQHIEYGFLTPSKLAILAIISFILHLIII